MLRTGLIHPQMLEALGKAGHGSLVLLSDGNFPHDTAPHRSAPRVYLNLRPGMISVIDALQAVLSEGADPATALAEAAEEANALIEDYAQRTDTGG